MKGKDMSNIFNGKQDILLFPADSDPATATPLDGVVADSLTIMSEEDTQEYHGEYTKGTYHFNCNIPTCSIFDIMFGGINPNFTSPFIIENFPEPARKPSNLKYPNKKRKMRVLKKWCNRYGWKHGRYLYIPRARFNGIEFEDEVPTFSFTAEKISE